MARTAEVKARVEPELKEAARSTYAKWGINLSDAMNAFLVKSVEVGGFPFDMRSRRYDWDAIGAIRADATGRVVLPAEMNDDDEGIYDDLV